MYVKFRLLKLILEVDVIKTEEFLDGTVSKAVGGGWSNC
jgi:hypothetical protein